MNNLKKQSLIGIIVPWLTLFYIILLSFIKPGYNQFQMTISYLGAGYSFIGSLASLFFILTGLSLIYFSWGLNTVLKKNNALNTGIFIMLFSFFDLIISGLFKTDLINSSISFTGFIHSLGSFIGDFFLLLSFIMFYGKDSNSLKSKNGKTFSLAVLIIVLLCMLITTIFHLIRFPNFPFGLVQRIEFSFIFVFLSFLGVILFKFLKVENAIQIEGKRK